MPLLETVISVHVLAKKWVEGVPALIMSFSRRSSGEAYMRASESS